MKMFTGYSELTVVMNICCYVETVYFNVQFICQQNITTVSQWYRCGVYRPSIIEIEYGPCNKIQHSWYFYN